MTQGPVERDAPFYLHCTSKSRATRAGVMLSALTRLGDAPCCSNSRTTWRCPQPAAKWRGELHRDATINHSSLYEEH
eukprot:9095206-Pyramimonas_sp.AAC.2